MNKQTVMTLLRIAWSVLWRAALAVAIVAALCWVGIFMILDTVFNGPSVTARDTLTLTLLEFPSTRDIPARYLGQDTVDAIRSAAAASMGTSDPSLVTVAPSGGQTATHTLEKSTATVQLLNNADTLLTADDGQDGNFWSINADGVLILSDSREALHTLGASHTASCGAVLMLDGKANEALLERSGYAAYTALGQRADGTFILVTCDGGSWEIPGASYRDLLNIMTEYGAVNACILSANEE